MCIGKVSVAVLALIFGLAESNAAKEPNLPQQVSGKVVFLPSTWDTDWLNQTTSTFRCVIGELQGGVAAAIDPSTVTLNQSVRALPGTFRVRGAAAGLAAPTFEISFNCFSAFSTLGWVVPGNQYPVRVDGKLRDGRSFSCLTSVIIGGNPMVDHDPPVITIIGVTEGLCTSQPVTPQISA